MCSLGSTVQGLLALTPTAAHRCGISNHLAEEDTNRWGTDMPVGLLELTASDQSPGDEFMRYGKGSNALLSSSDGLYVAQAGSTGSNPTGDYGYGRVYVYRYTDQTAPFSSPPDQAWILTNSVGEDHSFQLLGYNDLSMVSGTDEIYVTELLGDTDNMGLPLLVAHLPYMLSLGA